MLVQRVSIYNTTSPFSLPFYPFPAPSSTSLPPSAGDGRGGGVESVSGEVWRGAGCMCGGTAGSRGGGLAAGDCWLQGSTEQTPRSVTIWLHDCICSSGTYGIQQLL